jgi:hypothetical protein
MIINIDDDQSSSRIHSPSTTNEVHNHLLETKESIFITLVLFSLRYSLAGMFWDRFVHAYEDLLDSKADTSMQQV